MTSGGPDAPGTMEMYTKWRQWTSIGRAAVLREETMTNKAADSLEKLPPIHPGEILKEEFLRPMNIMQYRLAKSIAVDPSWVHAIVYGERDISPETALLFSRFSGNSARFRLGLRSQYGLEKAEEILSEKSSKVVAYSPNGPAGYRVISKGDGIRLRGRRMRGVNAGISVRPPFLLSAIQPIEVAESLRVQRTLPENSKLPEKAGHQMTRIFGQLS